ncbi:hypothetical protein [Alicyclobacillus acidocaldarius]|uniref:hypothetical protein n=1 Tax=Alicyclobacillus acidocaldarius TaxID=405212 RepID=UPI0005A27641|nr:hypothetical protein [Alicyclobacillus acidocaldarius]
MPESEAWRAHGWAWDPRPDLQLDHDLWKLLLTEIVTDEELGWVLNGARCAGCRLVWNGRQYRIEPTIDPRLGFNDEEEWSDFREKYLVPSAQQIQKVLKLLTIKVHSNQKLSDVKVV